MNVLAPGPRPRDIEVPADHRASGGISHDLLQRLRGEFREMPGMQLTLSQASRLFRLDRLTCDVALRTLAEEGFLSRTRAGAFRQADG